MTESVYCAVCRNRIDPAGKHVYLDAETKDPDDMNRVDGYALHPDCWRSVSGGWMDPA